MKMIIWNKMDFRKSGI